MKFLPTVTLTDEMNLAIEADTIRFQTGQRLITPEGRLYVYARFCSVANLRPVSKHPTLQRVGEAIKKARATVRERFYAQVWQQLELDFASGAIDSVNHRLDELFAGYDGLLSLKHEVEFFVKKFGSIKDIPSPVRESLERTYFPFFDRIDVMQDYPLVKLAA